MDPGTRKLLDVAGTVCLTLSAIMAVSFLTACLAWGLGWDPPAAWRLPNLGFITWLEFMVLGGAGALMKTAAGGPD